MAGRLRRSFRFGNLSEHLGLLLLKGIAAVADVPRTEDVGLDAVASLLRSDDDGNAYAEDSFLVQFKSDSVVNLDYQEHELKWLLAQSQPMFIGRVSLRDSRLSLHPTLYVNQAALALHPKRIAVLFGMSDVPSFLGSGHTWPWCGGLDPSATVWLGKPLLKWTLDDLSGSEWSRTAYQILKRFLRIARLEYELLSIGQCSNLAWSTNDADTITSSFLMMRGHPDELKTLAQKCLPGLRALLANAVLMPENLLMTPLLGLVRALRDLGMEIDAEDVFAK